MYSAHLHRRRFQVSSKGISSLFSHHTLCGEQIRAPTRGVSTGVDILFLSLKKCTGADQRLDQRRNLIRLLEDRPVSCLSLARKTTKLASDREISQSTAAFSPPLLRCKICTGRNFCPPQNLGLVFQFTVYNRIWQKILECSAAVCSCWGWSFLTLLFEQGSMRKKPHL